MKKYLNLMPVGERNAINVNKAICIWSLGALLCAVFVGFSCYSLNVKGNALQQKVLAAEQEFRMAKAVESTFAELEEKLVHCQNVALASSQVNDQQPVLTLMGTLSSAVAENAEQLCVQNFDLKRLPAEDESAINSGSKLILKGVATESLAIARFAASLEKSRRFLKVELKSTSKTALVGKEAYTYELECIF